MSRYFIKFQGVTFKYESAAEPLFQNVSLHFPSGWTGVVGANGSGKSTLLKLAARLLIPDQGLITAGIDSLYCPQRTDHVPNRLDELVEAKTRSAILWKERLAVPVARQDDWIKRWTTLSHGERKRAQIAVALWLNPGLLAIDEPTNHVDTQAQEIIAQALHAYQGIGLLVSHDRLLLDSLCQQCLFIDPPEVFVRPGGYTRSISILRKEQEAVQKQSAVKKQVFKKIKREVSRRRKLADESRKRRSKKGLARKDHDAKEKIDRARITGKDAVAGNLKRQLSGRLKQAQEQYEAIRVKKEYTLGIWLPGSVSKRDFLLKLPAGRLALGREKQLHYPELFIKPTDRIALTGENGVGKSTLIRVIVGALNVPGENITYIPQEIDLKESGHILAQARELPHERLGHLMNIVSRLGSRPHRLLDSTQPSPGEIRKLLLALGMTRQPHILIMDEPTNHLDLPSIECLEHALADCPCALLLVSHDRPFLEKLTRQVWRINRDTCVEKAFVLEM